MATRTDLVVLSITYDPAAYDPPQTWDWNNLCDMADPDAIKVLPKLPDPNF